MSDDTVMVYFSWDSAPYGIYVQVEHDAKVEIEPPNGYGTNTVPIPRLVWERYERAANELSEAEAALDAAEQAYLDEARKDDPRWQNRN